MFIPRDITDILLQHRQWFPVIYMGGPRQSGKTTLLRHILGDMPYANLEDPELRLLAEGDPRRFLERFSNGGILDEAQRVPHLFSYLQGLVDENKSIQFFLSGSQNFLLMESITQSLAGRVGLINLLPFSYREAGFSATDSTDEYLFNGGFPALYERKTPHHIFFNNYIQTYLERDVRLLKNVGNLSDFARFMKLCAGRVGQPLNMSSLATDTGVSVNTVKAWLSVLEASYLVFFLQPYHNNFAKRIIKSPKMYFVDTGLLCFLLGITSSEQLEAHYFYGNIFENAVILELLKKRHNKAQRPNFWYWQDQHGNEIDLIIEDNSRLLAVELKAARTYITRLIKNLNYWQKLTGAPAHQQFLVYAGVQQMELEWGTLLPWQNAVEILQG